MGLDIQSKEVIDKISDELKVQPAMSIPRELGEKIQLVYGVNPITPRKVLSSTTASGSGSSNLLTTNATKLTYMTGLQYSFVKNVTSDLASGSLSLTVIIGGATVAVVRLSVLTLTAERGNISVSFDKPMLLDKGSLIRLSSDTFSAGALIRSAIVYGYETDPQ